MALVSPQLLITCQSLPVLYKLFSDKRLKSESLPDLGKCLGKCSFSKSIFSRFLSVFQVDSISWIFEFFQQKVLTKVPRLLLAVLSFHFSSNSNSIQSFQVLSCNSSQIFDRLKFSRNIVALNDEAFLIFMLLFTQLWH